MNVSYSSILPSYLHEINGSRSESYTTTEFTSHVEYTCPWEMRSDAYHALMACIYNAPPAYFKDYLPAEAQQVQVNVFGAEGNLGPMYTDTFQPYSLAKLAVDYKGFSRPGKLTLQEQVQPSFKMRQLPSWGYYWRSDGSPVLDNESPAIQEVQCKITRTIQGIHFIPEWFYRLAGCVNNACWADQITGMVYLPGTLMFIPTNFNREITYARGDEDYNWNISFELNWNPIGWNNFLRPSGVDTFMKNGYPVCLYPYASFATLGSDLFDIASENCILYAYDAELLDESTGEPIFITVTADGIVSVV